MYHNILICHFVNTCGCSKNNTAREGRQLRNLIHRRLGLLPHAQFTHDLVFLLTKYLLPSYDTNLSVKYHLGGLYRLSHIPEPQENLVTWQNIRICKDICTLKFCTHFPCPHPRYMSSPS
jgi:hypothetical protein